MKKKLAHIALYFLPGLFLALLAVVSASAQNGAKPVPSFDVTQCDTLQLEVQEWPGDRYTWDIYSDSEGNFAINQGDMEAAVYFEGGMYEGATVRVTNLPVGTYFLRVMVWDEVQCTNNLMVFKMNVVEPPPPELVGDSLCIGEVPLVRVIFSGTGPWDFSYGYSDESGNTVNLIGHTDEPDYTIPILTQLPEGKATFWIMEVVDGCGIAHEYTVDQRPTTGILIYPKPAKQPIYLKED